MKSFIIKIIFCLFCFPVFANAGTTIFTNVNVIPMDRPGILLDQTVVIEGQKITFIGDKIPTRLQKSFSPKSVVISGKGKFLMPGLTDMHVHFGRNLFEGSLALYLANGVTTVREMSTRIPSLLAMREDIKQGKKLGPNLILSSPASGGWGGNPTDVWSEAQTLAALYSYIQDGFDAFKVYDNFTLAVYQVLVNEAAKLGFPLVGHVPRSVPVPMALAMNQNTIEHFRGFNLETEPDDSPFKTDVSPMAMSFYRGAYLDQSKLDALATLAGSSKTYFTSTAFITSVYADLEAFPNLANRPEMKYIPQSRRDEWIQWVEETKKRIGDKGPFMKMANVNFIKTLKSSYQSGAKLLIGTDSWNELGMIPGFSIHDEMRIHHEDAGIPIVEVLKAATINSFNSLSDKKEVFGMVVTGARADLLLLNMNPLESLENLKAPLGVMIRGRWISQIEIQKMLTQVEHSEDKWLPAGDDGMCSNH